jgi:prevent-host-death family protein
MVDDHGEIEPMEEMAISEFKAKCLAVLERVRRTRKPVLVTRFGKPVAEVVPPSPPSLPQHWMGSMRSSGRIVGDIVAPVMSENEWEALR